MEVVKRIVHTGEVNRLRSFPATPSLVATHSDSPHVFVWDTRAQPGVAPSSLASAAAPPPGPVQAHVPNVTWVALLPVCRMLACIRRAYWVSC